VDSLIQEAISMKALKFLALSAIIVVAVLAIKVQMSVGDEGDEGYVGSETCIECHEEDYETYVKNHHAVKGDPRTPEAKLGCESCHGPGAVHSEEETPEDIVGFGPESETQAETGNAICLGCHTKGKLAIWHGSIHEDAGLSCANCHSIHGEYSSSRSKPNEIELCTQCHQRTKPELLRQSHHPIREGKITCSDCHNPHGTVSEKLVDAQYSTLKCYECHAEKRGPFLWEHPPVVEDCITCHTPHGSARTPLLRAKMPYVCQRCHSNVAHPSQLQARRASDAGQSVYRVLNNRGFYRACLNCHISIHGSNHSSGKSLLR
jgi:DmsE family decaheme c-type cytochrome